MWLLLARLAAQRMMRCPMPGRKVNTPHYDVLGREHNAAVITLAINMSRLIWVRPCRLSKSHQKNRHFTMREVIGVIDALTCCGLKDADYYVGNGELLGLRP
jgi:hypothetical protein